MEIIELLRVGLVSDEQLSDWMVDAVRRRHTADLTAEEYEHRKPKIEKGIRNELIRLNGVAEDYAFRKQIEVNWALNDLIKKHAWHRDESTSLNLAIQTQLALRAAIAAEEAKGRVSA